MEERYAKTLQERTYEHSPSQLGGYPVTVGYGSEVLKVNK
jgi:hypothetical protein